MPHARLAIALPSRNVWSETFIAAHLERLKEVRTVLSGGTPPTKADGQPLIPQGTLSARIANWSAHRIRHIDHATRARQRITQHLQQCRAQVVLAEYGPTGASILDVCQAAGVPLVVHFHGYDAYMKQPLEKYGRYARLFAGAHTLIAVSRHMEQQLLSLGAPREKVHYNCYGIDLQHFSAGHPDRSGPHFLAVGRFVDKKAPELTLLAFKKVAERHPEARLTMVGDGALKESCHQLIGALGLGEQVRLAGIQSPDTIAGLLRNSRAFVQHSVATSDNDHEGTPLSILEAMATGVPVVATRHAGIMDVVEHGQRGLLCDERDVHAMAANMVRLIEDPALAAAMGVAGRAYVERAHRIEDRIASLQAILDRAAGLGDPARSIDPLRERS